MSRWQNWEGLPHEAVQRLIASDLDGMEATIKHLDERLDERLGGITKVLVGILVSVSTAAILLAVNLTVIGGT